MRKGNLTIVDLYNKLDTKLSEILEYYDLSQGLKLHIYLILILIILQISNNKIIMIIT